MKAPFFFVLGLPRSGGAWVQMALDAHPGLTCRGEGKFMVFRRELTKAALKYSEYLTGHQKTIFGEEFFAPMSRPEFDSLYRFFIEHRLLGEGDAPEGVRRVGNRDSEHGMVLSDLGRHFPDAAFIQVVRDPRDVAVSTWHHLSRLEPEVVEKIGGFEPFARQNVKEWGVYIRSVRKVAREKGLDYVEVRYEDLHADGPATLRRLLEHLGVDAEPAAACLEAADFERLSGRPRGQADETAFHRKGVVGDWRGHMPEALSASLLESTQGLAAELGYR